MCKAISILGSTGSIGRQTLEIAGHLDLRVRALSAHRNIKLLEDQVRRYRPALAAVSSDETARDFRPRVRDLDVRVVSGADGLIEAATIDDVDAVVTAVVGAAGLAPTLAAIRLGRRIALANKETLVCAGEHVMNSARDNHAEIIPVDSEHSALFQCLGTHDRGSVKTLHLTASGGPFRGWSRAELMKASPAMALRHPNWNMGKKVTVDSATLMNKGLEVIEAMHLFSVPPDKINVVVHPESIVHSMVEFNDNTIMAQLACPDMRLPIQYALTYPHRLPSRVDGLDVTLLSALTFEKPDTDLFPCLELALDTARAGGTACAVLNYANEAAVELFLRGELSFYGMYDSIRFALDSIENNKDPSLEEITAAGETAKRLVFERNSKCI